MCSNTLALLYAFVFFNFFLSRIFFFLLTLDYGEDKEKFGISEVTESSTCVYEIVFYNPLMCAKEGGGEEKENPSKPVSVIEQLALLTHSLTEEKEKLAAATRCIHALFIYTQSLRGKNDELIEVAKWSPELKECQLFVKPGDESKTKKEDEKEDETTKEKKDNQKQEQEQVAGLAAPPRGTVPHAEDKVDITGSNDKGSKPKEEEKGNSKGGVAKADEATRKRAGTTATIATASVPPPAAPENKPVPTPTAPAVFSQTPIPTKKAAKSRGDDNL